MDSGIRGLRILDFCLIVNPSLYFEANSSPSITYSSPKRKPNIPQPTPATTQPAGINIIPAPILVNSIKQNISTFADLGLFTCLAMKTNGALIIFTELEPFVFTLFISLALLVFVFGDAGGM